MNEKKDRVTDALNATKAAVEEGIVPGMFVTFPIGLECEWVQIDCFNEFPSHNLGVCLHL